MIMTTETRLISLYKDAWQNDTDTEITVQEFFDGIALGRWKRHVEWVRDATDKKEYDRRKKSGNAVTIAGAFNKRNATSIREFSGLMAVDLDHLGPDLMRVFNLLKIDPYVFAVFRSIGGNGLCVVFRVIPERWLDSFEGIQKYLMEEHTVVVGFDSSVKDVSRLRFVSWDPDIFVNTKAQLFRKYLKKEPKKAKKQEFIHTEDDIEFVISQIEDRCIEFHDTGGDWVRAGLALASKYDSAGRDYFQRISQFRHDYDPDEVDKKYEYLCKNKRNEVTIATFYYLCKNLGLQIMTPRTKEVVSVAAMSKKQKIKKESALDTVLKMTDATEEQARPIIDQVYAAQEEFDTEETIFDQLELFLKQNHQLRYNEVKRVFEDESEKAIEDPDLYQMYIRARKYVDDRIKYTDFFMLIHSHMVFPKVHPLKEFFSRNAKRKPKGVIDKLIESIETDTGFTGSDFAPSYAGRYIRKWLIGMISTIYGEPCPLVLILTGAPNTGKTSWFRQLLPDEIASYRIESKWVDNKEEEIRMCTNLMSFNDEFDMKDKASRKHFRALTSRDIFTVREFYGRKDVRLKRMAVMCGTSNPKGVIDDPEFNRRIIPINVLKVKFDIYNAVDKTDLLMEAYHAYMAGERHDLTQEDIKELHDLTEEFQNKTIEQQLVDQYLVIPDKDSSSITVQFLSTTEILSRLELRVNNRKLDLNKVGSALQAAGFVRTEKRLQGRKLKGYNVIYLE